MNFVHRFTFNKYFFLSEEGQVPNFYLPLRNHILHSLLFPNLDGLNLLQMSQDHESLKLDPKERRLIGSVNEYNVDLSLAAFHV